jgi:hypothetical protein
MPTRPAKRRFDVTNLVTGLDLVKIERSEEEVGIFKLITVSIAYRIYITKPVP